MPCFRILRDPFLMQKPGDINVRETGGRFHRFRQVRIPALAQRGWYMVKYSSWEMTKRLLSMENIAAYGSAEMAERPEYSPLRYDGGTSLRPLLPVPGL